MSRGPVADPLKLHPLWRGAAAFAAVAGVLIIVVGVYLLSTDYYRADLSGAPWTTIGRLAGEGATALILLFAAWALTTGRSFARTAYLVAMGMLVFASFQGIGHYAQSGAPGMLGLYFLLGVLAVFFAVRAEE